MLFSRFVYVKTCLRLSLSGWHHGDLWSCPWCDLFVSSPKHCDGLVCPLYSYWIQTSFLKCVITSSNVNYNIHGQFWCHYCLLSSKKFITLVYLPYWNNYFKTKYDAFCIFWKTEFRNRKVSEMSKIKLFLLCVRSILILLWLDINLTFIFTHFQSVTVSKKEGKKILLKLVATKSRKTQSLSHTFVIMKKKMTDSKLLLIVDFQNLP